MTCNSASLNCWNSWPGAVVINALGLKAGDEDWVNVGEPES